MDDQYLLENLADLQIPAIRYFEETGSTNADALEWITKGALDFSMVIAERQTAGRGRKGRRWITQPGSSLAFSVIIKPTPDEMERLALFAPLGGIAVSQSLIDLYGLQPLIKWPNDVLLLQRKVCGVLAEAEWQEDHLSGVALGIGINVAPSSVPPEHQLLFPAGCIEDSVGRTVDRFELLREVIKNLQFWRNRLSTPQFLAAWENRLAFRGEWVRVVKEDGDPIVGRVKGMHFDGSLILVDASEVEYTIVAGDVHLRPID
jgi:BirA family biotin operon repressor/biotin-[acetyl-CoA-carboxylase] ligase